MARPPSPELRERILHTAFDLFYRRGFRAVGIDEVVERSGVAKMTLYKHFPSKDDLMAAILARHREESAANLAAALAAMPDDPISRLLGLFDYLETWFGAESFRGCPFLNAIAELADPDHPATREVRSHHDGLRETCRRLAVAAGARDPALLAERWLLLMNGAIIGALVAGEPGAARVAKGMASDLLGHLR